MQAVVPIEAALKPPEAPGKWTLAQIQAVLSRPLPGGMIKVRKQGGKDLKYIPWHTVNKILDKYCPGWSWEIKRMELSSDRVFVVGCLTIPTADGDVSRDATGTEMLQCSSYGDPSSNAESMAFRRAAARFGLGLYLYKKD